MNERPLTLNHFNMLSVIGKGSYAKVVLVRRKDNDQLYAIKILKKKYLKKMKQENQVMVERNILVKLNHPFIVKLYNSFQDRKKLYFVLEFCAGGELFNLLQKKPKLSEEHTKFFAAQIVLAIQYLHSLQIVYRDLKPENVLIDRYGYVRLTDFGLSNSTANTADSQEVCGTAEYLAPQILLKKGHGKPVDWWCVGCIICEMMMGIPPFFSKSYKQLFRKIKTERPTFPNCSLQLRNLLEGLFNKNPQERLGSTKGAEEIKSNPWFQNIDWTALTRNLIKPPFLPVLSNNEDVTNFAPEFTESNIDSGSQSLSEVRSEGGKYEGFSFEGSPVENRMEEEMEFELKIEVSSSDRETE